jgi:PAS domain S-box-containing protein
MLDHEKSREQLLHELLECKQRIRQLEQLAVGHTAAAGETADESRERYKTLFETATEGILITDIDSRTIQFTNGAFERILGYPPRALRGARFDDLIPEVHRTQVLADFELQANSEKNEITNLPLLRKGGGSTVFVDASATLGVVGGRECVINFVRDITERKLAEDRIRQLNDVILSIVNQLRAITLMVDVRGQVAFLSDSGLALVGLSAEEVVGIPWQEAFPLAPGERMQLELSFGVPASRREPLALELELSGGRRFVMEAHVHDDPRDPERRIVFFYDTTEVHDLRQQVEGRRTFHDLSGRSEPMQALFRHIDEVAGVDWTVLIEGETGSGKELVARAIHQQSARAKAAFVPVNCAGLTDSLLGSQLFGHRRGSFTGAVSDHQGVFEAAHGGTVFLDEIGDISPSVQTSLLRVLESREVTRLGESKPRKIDVRILAATHRNLQERVTDGAFRADLLYRVRAARIRVPALRERRADIPQLTSEFLQSAATATGKSVTAIAEEAMRVLLEHDWPGNVRELKGAMEYAVLHATTDVVDVDDLPPEVTIEPGPRGLSSEDERERFLVALNQAGGNRSIAARLLGMSRATFYRRLSRLGIKV